MQQLTRFNNFRKIKTNFCGCLIKSFFTIFILIAVLLLSCCSEKRHDTGTEDNTQHLYDSLINRYTAKLDSFFLDTYNRGEFNGTALFAVNGVIVYKNFLGYADIIKKDTLKINTSFQLASVTKPFTAFAIMLLEKRGKLSLEDSVRKFFPSFPYDNITVHQLLIHRSGLPEYFYFTEKLINKDSVKSISNSDVINFMIKHYPKRYYMPGQKYNYINTNYCILAAIIEKVSGKSYADFMRDEIFVPLEMDDTFVYNGFDQNRRDNTAQGFIGKRRADDTYLNGVLGDKGVYSTVDDLYKFDLALYSGKLLDTLIIQKAFFLGHDELYTNDNYGYGWRIIQNDDGSMISYHGGWWRGFRTYFIRDLKQKKTIVVLTNQSKARKISIHRLMDLFDIEY